MTHGLRGTHILSISQFNTEQLHHLFGLAERYRRLGPETDCMRGKVMACLFYEASTRTFASFTSAMLRLGGSVIPIQSVQFSSVTKGETLADTVRAIEAYSDVIVLRHPEEGSAAEAAAYLKKPLINAGDGIGEHPTQALLDAFTIRAEKGTLENLRVTMVGDLRNGRTVHSLARLLSQYPGTQVTFVSPESLRLPPRIVAELREKKVELREIADLQQVISKTDVLYVTRIQKERFSSKEEYERVKDSYVITPESIAFAPDRMVLMHPLPRINEISSEVDADPRAAYFRQVEYGLHVRMALLTLVLG